MRRHGAETLLSASDLITLMGCAHASYLDLRNLSAPMERANPDPMTELLQQKGIEHEQRYLARLRGEGRGVVEIDRNGTLEDQVRRTRDAMRGGADVIYQGALFHGDWHGYSDFLIRTVEPSGLGAYSYEVADTKLARTPKPKHVVQLVIYSDLVAIEQQSRPQRMHLVLGDGSQTSFRLAEFMYYGRVAQRRLEAFVALPPATSASEPCSHCAHCGWQDRCAAEWEAADHLRLVAGLRRDQADKLRAAGCMTAGALAALPLDAVIPKVQRETLQRLRTQAALQTRKRTDGKNHLQLLPAAEGRGFTRLPEPDAGDLFFDIEGDPLFEGGLEYLFGFVEANGRDTRYVALWAHDRAAERAAFESAVDLIVDRLKARPKAHVYHYAAYEESALKRLAMLHGTRENEIDNLLRSRKLVDLYKVVREGMRVSQPAYSLKNIETFYMPCREGEVKTGGESVVIYERWRRGAGEGLLREIETYNEADCRSLFLLHRWLLDLRPKETPWFVPDVTDDEDPKRAEKRKESEERTAAYSVRLLACAAEETEFRQLVSHLIEFHRREAKPRWWAMFDRQNAEEERLIDDAECLGGLRRDPSRPPRPEKRSMIHMFTFPPQDFKLSAGQKPLRWDTLKMAGEIFALDEEKRLIALKVGPSAAPLPDALSLLPEKPFDDYVMRDALLRYADAVLAGGARYQAVTSVLRREPPRIQGLAPGRPIIADGANAVLGTIGALQRMSESHLVVQGPPGAGKTYTSAHAIVALLRAKKRIGVSAHSHKAINKLLEEVETVALAEGVRFRGVKKSSQEDQLLKGKIIEDTTDNDDVSAAHQLVAGTAWLFAREEFDQAFDYLFVDEAGQMSLANVVAIGVAARTIVLVGDQMQLSQPIQGVHPGGSGVSALEHLLQGAATVSPDRGVFLATTRRMHPDVCRFISDAVYDGRLQAEASNACQRLVLIRGCDVALATSGLRFVGVEHTGCSQRSDEEAERVRRIYVDLLRQRWIDRHQIEYSITAEDVLVVSPYNIQVNRLRDVLPPGARVGTVDKFQGQEAAVVLISMATSSAEDLPRDIGFLFSRNRLNVAISRARALAVIVANPRLLEVPCTTIEQMRLVNGFCWASAYASA